MATKSASKASPNGKAIPGAELDPAATPPENPTGRSGGGVDRQSTQVNGGRLIVQKGAESMSKRKILSAFQEGLEQLSSALPEESREPLKKLERAFVEMRQRHSESERRRQEAEELCRKQQETITALETYRTEMDAALHQRSQIVDRLRRLLAERISGQTSCEKIENVRRQFEPAMFDLAERLGFNTKERWDFLAVEFNRTVVPHYQKHSHVLADELNFFKHLLMLCCRQYGPLDLMEEEVGRGESFLRWKYRDGRWHLELVASDQEEQTEEEKATGPTGSNPA